MANIFSGSLAGIPNWAWMIAAAGGIGIGVMILKNRQAAAVTDSSIPDILPPANDTGSYGSGLYGSDHEIIVVPQPAPIQTQTPPSGSGPPSSPGGDNRPPSGTPDRGRSVKLALIRARHAKDSIPAVKDWDNKFTGVPRRSSPSPTSSQVDFVPFSSTVQITGNSVQGGNNLPQAPNQGSYTWYPTDRGYVNAFDVDAIYNANTSSSNNSSSGTVNTHVNDSVTSTSNVS